MILNIFKHHLDLNYHNIDLYATVFYQKTTSDDNKIHLKGGNVRVIVPFSAACGVSIFDYNKHKLRSTLKLRSIK